MFLDKTLPNDVIASDPYPVPIYQRGFYFDGITYASFPNFILNTSFTWETYFWYSGGVARGTLLATLTEVVIWELYVAESMIKFHAHGENSVHIPSGPVDTGKWVLAALVSE